MRRKLPPLNAIKTFEAVARNSSFRKASQELFVTEPATSRAIKVLEDHFQTKLFDRQPKGLELTPEGKFLLPIVSQALDDIAAAAGDLYLSSCRHNMSLLVSPHISTHWLMPKLKNFLADYPQLDIGISSSVEHEDVINSDFDVAIWWGHGEWEGYQCDPLFTRSYVPACSPELASAAKSKEKLSLIETQTLLHEYDYQNWTDWLEHASASHISATRGLIFNNYESMLEAAVAGYGIALLLYPFFTDHLEKKQLVLPFGADESIQIRYYIVYREKSSLSEEAAAFVDMILGSSED